MPEGRMKLSELLENVVEVDPTNDPIITALSLDSRSIMPGMLFLALKGNCVDGRRYIPEVIKQGASAIIYEANDMAPAEQKNLHAQSIIPLYALQNLDQMIGILADRFYKHPSQAMSMVGVTGTNGKTSCCLFLAEALAQVGQSCGVIGTNGYGFLPDLKTSKLTTPDSITLQQWLAEMKKADAKTIAMEVSSHALVQGRANGINFDIGVFTNLSRDHLDYHGDMQAYGEAKRLLFLSPGLHYAVINIDDGFGAGLVKQLDPILSVYTYSTAARETLFDLPSISASDIELTGQGMKAVVDTPWGKGDLHSSLLGQFNLSNLLAVLTCLCLKDIPFEKALNSLASISGVKGRMECFGGGEQPLVVVDFAHTPDALAKVLQTLKPYCKARLTCIFGCGGDRDSGKRAPMGRIAEHHSDAIVVTNDNPRHERPQEIVQDILQGIQSRSRIAIELDRKKAIYDTIRHAQAGDVILVAGKGHEEYQLMGDEQSFFSDQVYVKDALNSM